MWWCRLSGVRATRSRRCRKTDSRHRISSPSRTLVWCVVSYPLRDRNGRLYTLSRSRTVRYSERRANRSRRSSSVKTPGQGFEPRSDVLTALCAPSLIQIPANLPLWVCYSTETPGQGFEPWIHNGTRFPGVRLTTRPSRLGRFYPVRRVKRFETVTGSVYPRDTTAPR